LRPLLAGTYLTLAVTVPDMLCLKRVPA
jgi:hypothetical protein